MPEGTRPSIALRSVRGAALVALGLAGAGSAFGQRSEVTVDVAECIELEAAERFACYEERVEAVLQENASTAPRESRAAEASVETREPATRGAERARQPSQRRGQDAEASHPSAPAAPAHAAADAAAERDEPGANEIFGTVTDLRETLPNSYVITLDNGQIWRQVRPKWYPLRPGLEVRLYPTPWGDSYRLTAVDGSGYIQVERAN